MAPDKAEPEAGPMTEGGDDDLDRGPRPAAEETVRRCVLTRERRPAGEMIRFVIGPDGGLVADLAQRLPGRGAWVCADRRSLEEALRRGAFARAFRRPVSTAPGMADATERLLANRILSLLGLARRAGDLVLGFEAVRESLREARPAALVEASDASADGQERILSLARAIYGAGENKPPAVIACFSASELGMALGRERVVHACLRQGRFASSLMGEIGRLSGFRTVGRSLGRSSEASVPA